MSDKMQKLKSWTRTSRGRVSMEDGHHSGRERYMPDDVLVISTPEGDRPALVVQASYASFSDGERVHFNYIGADGWLLDEGDYISSQNAEKTRRGWPVAHLDTVKNVNTFVDLPPNWRERAAKFTPRSEYRKPDGVVTHEPEAHPAYGALVLAKVSGHTALFNSPFKHQHYITLSLHRATLNRSYGSDGHHAGQELAEVAMSEAQWAHFISSAGTGNGCAVTITRLNGRLVERCPEQLHEERAHGDMEKAIENAFKFLGEAQQLAAALVDEKAPSKEKRKAVAETFAQVGSQLTDTIPFLTRMYTERMANVKEAAKTETEAYMMRVLQQLGLDALRDRPFTLPGEEKTTPKLERGDTDGDTND